MRVFLAVLLLIIALFGSCKFNETNKKFVNGKQIPIFNSDKSKIAISGLDSIFKGQQFRACIIQTQKGLHILNAYVGSHPDTYCDFSKSLIDTTSKEIDNSSIKLETLNDTAYFFLNPSVAKNLSYKLAVLSTDKNSNYYLDTLNMNFVVRERNEPKTTDSR